MINTDILFYTTKGDYGCFTNYSRHNVYIPELNLSFPTSEHSYMSFKFYPHRPDLIQFIIDNPSPKHSGVIGRDRNNPMREDWELSVNKELLEQFKHLLPKDISEIELTKDLCMYVSLYYKFNQHPDIKAILLSTENRVIIEKSDIDWYWGIGKDNTGKNKLGKLLMVLRDNLRDVSLGESAVKQEGEV